MMITEKEILDFIGPPLPSRIKHAVEEIILPLKDCIKCNLPMLIENHICPNCHAYVGGENDVYGEMARKL